MKGPKLTIPFTGNKTYPTTIHNNRRGTTMRIKVNTDMHLLNEFQQLNFERCRRSCFDVVSVIQVAFYDIIISLDPSFSLFSALWLAEHFLILGSLFIVVLLLLYRLYLIVFFLRWSQLFPHFSNFLCDFSDLVSLEGLLYFWIYIHAI